MNREVTQGSVWFAALAVVLAVVAAAMAQEQSSRARTDALQRELDRRAMWMDETGRRVERHEKALSATLPRVEGVLGRLERALDTPQASD